MLPLLALALTPTAALRPAEPWQVETLPAVCRATRRFGGAPGTLLRVVTVPLSGRFLVTVDLPDPVTITYGDPVQLVTGPGGASWSGTATGFANDGDQQTTVGLFVPMHILAAPGITGLGLRAARRTLVELATGDLAPLVASLAGCERKLALGFGIDLAAQGRVAQTPKPTAEPESWFGADNYPKAALRAGLQGRVGVRFQVTPDGRVRGCVPVLSSGSSDLDQGTCAVVVKYARYRPALDAAGRPVASAQFVVTRWTLPS